MHRSHRSKPVYLPRFPRLQLQQRLRRQEEAMTFEDVADDCVHVRPNRSAVRAH